MTSTSDYVYDHVQASTLNKDMAFRPGTPGPGDRLPVFDLPAATGGRIRSHAITGNKPMLLVTGSYTCPMTAASNPALKRLHRRYGGQIVFVMLHVREAHPGERFDQPHDMDTKIRNARILKERDSLPWALAVDDTQGTLHKQLDEKPNAVWLTDREGTIVYRGLWAGDDEALGEALEAVSKGRMPRKRESTARLKPMAAGIGVMREVTQRSGKRAEADLWKAAPPVAALARIADLYRPLPPHWRTAAAAATIGLGATALVGALTSARKSARKR
ncbi:MAG: TlpA family protein disulfide reductase [Limimaricola soesokkakensis]|uniref:TlpA family protein disulfide reductase n=1 Tax=Limimaricola soesokkakensis TaxID=1343159 RepID=UPI00405A2DD9